MPDPGSGEKRGYREAMERMVGQMVQSGTTPEKAREIAKQQAIRADREGRTAKD